VVFFAPFMAFSNFFISPIFLEYSQKDYENQYACKKDYEKDEVFEAVFGFCFFVGIKKSNL